MAAAEDLDHADSIAARRSLGYRCPMPDLDSSLPSSLRAISEHVRLGPDVPCLVVRPEPGAEPAGPTPFLIWMHGRTANKELDPGRYLRLARAGIGSCAVDLPGHGFRTTEPLPPCAATNPSGLDEAQLATERQALVTTLADEIAAAAGTAPFALYLLDVQ